MDRAAGGSMRNILNRRSTVWALGVVLPILGSSKQTGKRLPRQARRAWPDVARKERVAAAYKRLTGGDVVKRIPD